MLAKLNRLLGAQCENMPVVDYFSSQMFWIKFNGVWRHDFTIGKFVPRIVSQACNWLLKRILFLIILHIAILFAITLYFDILNGDFGPITYSLSQTVIFVFIAFMILYLQLREDLIFEIVDIVNDTFKFRSAKGMLKIAGEFW